MNICCITISNLRLVLFFTYNCISPLASSLVMPWKSKETKIETGINQLIHVTLYGGNMRANVRDRVHEKILYHLIQGIVWDLCQMDKQKLSAIGIERKKMSPEANSHGDT